MKINRLRSIIRESIHNNIKEIEDVAENAAMEAKKHAYTEAIEKVNKKIEMAESLEEMQELVDPAKLNELKKHLKDLQKSKEKLEKLQEKKNKGKKVVTDEPVEDANVEEAAIEEDDMPKAQKLRASGEDDNWNDDIRGFSWNTDQLEDDAQLEEGTLNESFLKMQKLAGVITEAQYNEKKINL
jgi:alanyl-tRNA synthetase